jgi:cysteine-S-conjugate beta-lyase
MRDETKYVAGRNVSAADFEAVSTPVHRASTVVFPGLEAFEARSTQFYDGYAYGLYGTPTTRTLEARLAELDGGTRAIVVPSGMAAISLVTLAVARPGRRVLVPEAMYGPARDMALRFLAAFGVAVTLYDPRLTPTAGQLKDASLVWVESPGSVTLEVQDVPAIVKAAHAAGALVAADNTWATPLLFKPLAHGCDFAMQALSKYASGHGDVLMGSVVVRDEAHYRLLKDTARFLGYGVSGDDCALTLRGLATMPLRLRQSETTANALMTWLAQQRAVASILHPSLPNHPGHAIWRRDFAGSSAGVFSMILKPAVREKLIAAFDAFQIFKIGASWGGVGSLLAPSDPRQGRKTLDWLPEGQLVRVSVGLEHLDDLIADLERAFAVLTSSRGRRSVDD